MNQRSSWCWRGVANVMSGLLAVTVLSCILAIQGRASVLDGAWAGWAYTNDGGDFPIRVHLVQTDTNPQARFDFPHAKLAGLEATKVDLQGRLLRLERVNSKGELWVFEGDVEQDLFAGNVEFDGKPYGEFQLHRSVLPLPNVDPDSYADLAGNYRFEDGRLLVLWPRFWGEMLARELSTGEYGTLFALSSNRFFLGSAMYVPTSIRALVDVERGDNGEVQGLVWTRDGQRQRAHRVEIVEEEIAFRNGDVELAGTLFKPSGPGPFAALAILGGSGWSERVDVRSTAQILTSAGFAALAYDKRGFGASSGEKDVAFSETADDAVAAVHYLQSRSDIHADKVGLTGRSRGGWLAPLAASRSDDVAFLVLLVAPAVSPAEQEHTRRMNVLRDQGATPEQLQLAEAYLEQLWQYCRGADNWEAYAALRAKLEDGGWASDITGPASADPAEWKWSKLNMHYDPVPALERVRVPTLAIFGGADRNVVPEINRPLMEAAFQRAGNQNATIIVIPDADHGLRNVQQRHLPLHRKTELVGGVWSLVQDWLVQHLEETP